MPTARGWLILWAITMTGCGSIARVPDHQDAAVDTVVSVPKVAPIVSIQREPFRQTCGPCCATALRWITKRDEPAVARALDIYLARAPMTLGIEEQARRYFAYVVDEVRARQLPMELALLPIIESTLNPYAYSHSGAPASGS